MFIEVHIPSDSVLSVDFSFNLYVLVLVLIPLLPRWRPVLLDYLITFACFLYIITDSLFTDPSHSLYPV